MTPKKILIAEDDKFLAAAYKAKLSKAEFDVLIAYDGEEALLKVEEFNPDIILLDIMMPKKDGIVVLKELRANPKWQTVPIIIASNLGQKQDKDQAMSLGASGYGIKSDLSLTDLILQIHQLLGQA